ncbi:hypothetical protein IGI04_010256 [Brassica rapa subsp. trilocularis]|uniref:Uncharacterized protein n=1 Tax=Brassica rapa subsp. trilocularis TaxID=1813537 RepID=A0ABQ7MZU1_BRACM|nr:hypothetical protein IGI04_010256 [Brassica rapa subsp. trilocularis]
MTLTLSMAETLDALIDNSQETDYSSAHPEEDNTQNIDLSLLRINSFGNSSDRRRANSSPPQFPSHGSFGSPSPAAATSPVKRPSPESKEADEPRRKKLFLPQPRDAEDDETIRSLSDTFSSRSGVAQETAPSLPPRPPVFRRCVSDVSPAASKAFHGTDVEANKMLYAIKNGVVELDQWCDKLLHYGESVKQDGSSPKRLIKEGVRELDQWCNKLINYGEDSSPKAQVESPEEEHDKECKEGVKVDRVGEAFVVEINCPCGRNYRTLFSGRDCYYKLL